MSNSSTPSSASSPSISKMSQPKETAHGLDGGTSNEDLERTITQHDGPEHEKPGLERTVTAQDWTGAHDPENPMNWPRWKRFYHTAIPAVLGFAATLGSSAYVPGISDLISKMHISHELALAGLSLWVLGIGFGPVIAAPLSERFGRRTIMQVSMMLSILFTIGSAVSTTPAALLVTRFFGGTFSGPVLSVGSGIIADVWQPIYRARATIFFVFAPFAGPALGPMVGGFAAQHKGWQWTQWVIVMFEGFAVLFTIPMSETHKATILKRRARTLDIDPPKSQLPEGGKAALKMALVLTLFRPLYMLATEPIVGLFSLYIAFCFSVLFAFFDAYPIVFQTVYGFDIETVGLTWLAVFLGCVLGILTFAYLDYTQYTRRVLAARRETGNQNARIAPEHRLYPAMAGSIGLPIGLFWLGWTARPDIHWISPVVSSIPFAWANFMIFNGCALYLIDTYGARAGASAMAANGLLRYGLGAAFPLFTTQMYEKLGVAWATSLFGFIALLMLPIPWALFKFGPQVRRGSRYGDKDI